MGEDHKVINILKRAAGGTMADQITDEMFSDEFLHLDPLARADILLKLDENFGETSDLRQEAQLMNLRRGFREIDLRMRKVGR